MAERRAKPRPPKGRAAPTRKRPAPRRARPLPKIPRPPPTPPRPTMMGGVPLWSVRGIFAFMLLVVLGLFLVATIVPPVVYFFVQPANTAPIDAALLWLNVAGQFLFMFLVPLGYIRFAWPTVNALHALGLRRTRATAAHIATGLGVAVATTIVLAVALFALREAEIVTEQQSDVIDELGSLIREHPEFLLVAPLAAGLFEETLFRGFLQPRFGILGSNVLFGLVHAGYGTVVQLVIPFLLGIGLGLLYRRTRTLWAPVAAHAGFDLIQLGLLYAQGGA